MKMNSCRTPQMRGRGFPQGCHQWGSVAVLVLCLHSYWDMLFLEGEKMTVKLSQSWKMLQFFSFFLYVVKSSYLVLMFCHNV